MILGITGGTGCGKTTLLKVIADQGGMILDCDAIYHQLLKTDPSLLHSIEARFPGVVVNGKLNRKKLGSIVFSDEKSLLDLNQITHAAVKAEVLRRLESRPALAAIDAIALFEGGLSELCDMTVAVSAPAEQRIERLMKRDTISESYARSRISAQHGEDWFRSRCGHVLVNDGSEDQFYKKCLAFLQQFSIIEQ